METQLLFLIVGHLLSCWWSFRETWSPTGSTSPSLALVWITTLDPLYGGNREPTDSTPSTSSFTRVCDPNLPLWTSSWCNWHVNAHLWRVYHNRSSSPQALAWFRLTSSFLLRVSILSEIICIIRYADGLRASGHIFVFWFSWASDAPDDISCYLSRVCLSVTSRFINLVDPDGELPGADGGSDEGKDPWRGQEGAPGCWDVWRCTGETLAP